MDLAAEKGASSWLTCRPLRCHHFNLTKREFRDAVCLRYNWLPPRLPTSCQCGKEFSVPHALSCSLGGFPTLRHNEIRDLTARALKQVAHQVQAAVEPHLQPLTGEQLRYRSANTDDQARLDVAASGIWGGRFERTFVDVRVFNPHASSNRSNSIAACYVKHEREKKRAYEQRVRNIEHASFVPAVLSTTGGMSRRATAFYKRIASLLAAEKTAELYSNVMANLRCRLSFALLRASVMCLRGARSTLAQLTSLLILSLLRLLLQKLALPVFDIMGMCFCGEGGEPERKQYYFIILVIFCIFMTRHDCIGLLILPVQEAS